MGSAVLVAGGSATPDEIVAEVRPDFVREARSHWGVESSAGDCP
ncbi:MAG TPA: hypothetical protein VFJ85_19495 [Acidimicrobiales bacterium]|nr:hypothetical protein [Acidimicrobiales bacterium]